MDVGLHFTSSGSLYLSIGMIVVAVFVTFVAIQKLKGPQPVTYGHVQTLVDLVDEWSMTTVMYWGHKKDGSACHAGTSDRPLEKVQMDAVYA